MNDLPAQPPRPPLYPKSIPLELRALRQWLAWRYVLKLNVDKHWKKVPYTWRGKHASTNNPATWDTLDTILNSFTYRDGWFDGVGFTFTEGDPFAGIDLDGVRDPLTGRIDPWAQRITDELDSYTEVSPSETGVHIFVRAHVGGGHKRKRGDGMGIEVYDRRRYFCVTGQHLPGTPMTIDAHQRELDTVCQRE